MRLILAYFFLTLCSLEGAKAQGYAYDHFGIESGLSSSTVYDVFQDSKGYIWFGTDAGVCKYDGYKMTTYSLADGLLDNNIYSFYEDNEGRVWFLTYIDRLTYFYEGKIHSAPSNAEITSTRNDDVTNSFYQDRAGNFWVGTVFSGYFTLDPELHLITQEKIKTTIQTIIVHPIEEHGMLVYPTTIRRDGLDSTELREQGNLVRLWHIDENNDTTETIVERYKYGTNLTLRTIRTQNGDIIIGADPTLFHIRNGEIVTHVFEDKRIINLNEDRNGLLLASTYNIGTCGINLDTVGKSSVVSNFLPGIAVTAVIQDTEGNYWFSTYEKGVYKLSHQNLEVYDLSKSLLTGEIHTILPYKGDTFLVSEGDHSLYLFHRGKVDQVYQNDSHQHYGHTARAIRVNENHYYIYIDGKICYFNIETGLVEESSLRMYGDYKELKYGKDSVIFAGTSLAYGYFLDDLTFNPMSRDPNNLTRQYFRGSTIEPWDDGSLFIGNYAGLWRHHDTVPTEPLTKYHYVFGTKIDRIIKYKSDQLIVAAPGYGILMYTPETGAIEEYQLSPEIVGNQFKKLVVDERDMIWALVARGLIRINPTNGAMDMFSYGEGIPQCQLNDLLWQNDSVWLATNCGMFHFNPLDNPPNEVPPAIHFSNVRISGRDTTILPAYNLSYEQNFISVDFVGLSYKPPRNITYKYMMISDEDEGAQWLSTNNTQVQFPSLPSGNYTFKVKAYNSDMVESEIAQISFNIATPYWRTAWFIVLLNAIALGVLLLIFYSILQAVRRKHIIAQQKLEFDKKTGELKQQALQAQMNPHFIFNALTSIQNFVLTNETTKANHYLTKFAKLTRAILEHSDSHWVLLDDEVASLTNYMELQRMRLENKFDYNLTVSDALASENVTIPPMLVQPFIENAIIHGIRHLDEQGQINISFEIHDDTVSCTVVDNGIGRNKSAEINRKERGKHKSKGFSITQERLALLAGSTDFDISAEVIDLYDGENAAGTKVIIHLPYQFTT